MAAASGNRWLVVGALLAFLSPGACRRTSRSSDFEVKRVEVGGGGEVHLDQCLKFVFTEPVAEWSIGPDSIRIRTADGRTPRGEYVRGEFLVDPGTGTTVAIDPQQIGPGFLERIEGRGRPDLVPVEIRYDLGARSSLNGARRVLLDRSRENVVTFVPEVPTLPDLSDPGFEPGETYTVTLTSRLRALDGDPLRRASETFTVVAPDAPDLFLGEEVAGPPRVVCADPDNGDVASMDGRFYLEFSQPLDPRTVTEDRFRIQILASGGQTDVPFDLELRQRRLDCVEVVLMPEVDLPLITIQVSILDGITDLRGQPLADTPFRFTVNLLIWDPIHPYESFDTNTKEDATLTTASWNARLPGGFPGELVAAPGGRESTAVSYFYNQRIPTPYYGTPEVDFEANGGTVEIFLQGSREDTSLPGEQPVDPDADPAREYTTDWVGIDETDRLRYYQYVRFRVEFRLPDDWEPGDPLPTVREIRIPVTLWPP